MFRNPAVVAFAHGELFIGPASLCPRTGCAVSSKISNVLSFVVFSREEHSFKIFIGPASNSSCPRTDASVSPSDDPQILLSKDDLTDRVGISGYSSEDYWFKSIFNFNESPAWSLQLNLLPYLVTSNFLSYEFIPHLAEAYKLEYDLATYKWPGPEGEAESH
ncbi:hypothetical protein B0H13DRAFT_2539203 [Mycena leptocephala]|nr:hypothetical protein B0H13DRAFT_2539203 [Mycena leptocephala]